MGNEARQSVLIHRILGMLADQPGLLLDQLLDRCPDATWNQVFAVVDRLSRTGEIRLTTNGIGRYHWLFRSFSNSRKSINRSRVGTMARGGPLATAIRYRTSGLSNTWARIYSASWETGKIYKNTVK